MGNAFPHNYADAGDDARGMMVLDWGEEPEFHAWPNQPIFRVNNLSNVLENPDGLLLPNLNIRVHLDLDISYEESNFIRETLIPKYNLREMALIPMKQEYQSELIIGEVKFESVDKIVTEGLSTVESDFYDPKILLEIYNTL